MTIKTYLKCSIYISNFIAFETTSKVFVSETNVEKDTSSFQQKETRKCSALTSKPQLLREDTIYI